MEEQVVCPWCATEIIWDEEFGPEENCPHCENELSGYRTMQFGIGEDDEVTEDNDVQVKAEEWSDDYEEENDDKLDNKHKKWLEQGEGYRNTNSALLAIEGSLQNIFDDQEEVPECPSCREYMLEAGTQKFNEQNFVSTVAPSVGGPILPTPFEVKWYVCPACFHTASLLSNKDREVLINRLTPKE